MLDFWCCWWKTSKKNKFLKSIGGTFWPWWSAFSYKIFFFLILLSMCDWYWQIMCSPLSIYLLSGCDALACAVCIFFLCLQLIILKHLQCHFLKVLIFFSVWILSFWKHCYVWKEYFLVMGYCSHSFLWCYMGTVSSQ